MAFINTDTYAYPVTRAQIEAAVGVNVIWSDANPPTPYKPVMESLDALPSTDYGEHLVEGTPELVSGVWRKTWTVETAPVPRVITRLQWILACEHLEILDELGTYIGGLAADNATRLYFENSANFDRDDPRYDALETGLGATEGDTDAVYTYAATLAP